MNTTEENILSEQIEAGSTEMQFKAGDVNNTGLMAILMREHYLYIKKGEFTMSAHMIVKLEHYIYHNFEKYKNCTLAKFIEQNHETELLNVQVKSWPRSVSKLANEYYKEYRRSLAIKKKEQNAIDKENPKIPKEEKKKNKINSRDKGKRGEQEINRILQPVIDKVYAKVQMVEPEGFSEVPKLQRNAMQSAEGGYDIVGIDWLAIEVKNCATLSLDKWWNQTTEQTGEEQLPVLLYKVSRKGWRCQMMGQIPIGLPVKGPNDMLNPEFKKLNCRVDIPIESFLTWFEAKLFLTLGLS
ncbi:MAG: hypothetical protein CMI54_05595 [Parcubacteria group bacterium]|jgi:hypothetical protein|nr:hypothetical protein [Parcubacteria group bacterium]|tara:strand:- start:330 stop:1223 length:894 start_codon:yes stop_codon:yes gene_type:complete